jgi:glycosyltransferase involved in cell wall biosynthesis
VSVAGDRERSVKTHLAFVVNTAAFFISHRLPIAVAALKRGYLVDLYTGLASSEASETAAIDELSRYPITHWRVKFASASLNPLSEGVGILELTSQLKSRRPDILHCVTPKGVLYGGIAARLAGIPALVAAVSGQGYAFTEGDRTAGRSIARWAYGAGSRLAYPHRNQRVIVQNTEDQRAIVISGMARADQTVLLPGSGVELSRYTGFALEGRQPIVLMPARMLRDKGVLEFAEAARILRNRGSRWRFVLAGGADMQNPSTVDEAVLREWHREATPEWLGHVEDMPSLYAAASIVCLPSYREGMPKTLLEAGAAGCAIVTTDIAGCREAILPGSSGDLVPLRNATALAEALQFLMDDPDRRERYGRAGRDLAITRHGIDAVVDRTLAIYDELLASS